MSNIDKNLIYKSFFEIFTRAETKQDALKLFDELIQQFNLVEETHE